MAGLFSPLMVKGCTLKNRIVLPPMANSMSDDSGAVTEAHIRHYVRRAKAEVGTVIVEHAFVHLNGRINAKQLGIHDDALIPGLSRLVNEIKACGTVVGVQITHGGGKAGGTSPLAPSAGIVPGGTEPAIAMSETQLAAIVEAFVTAARRAVVAGFDFVEIHGAHGYLLNEFLSPLTNKRSDDYGGDLQGRLRLPVEVVTAVREAVGDDYLLLYRLGASDYMPGGTTEEEGCQAAQALVNAGVDILDISGGLCGSQLPGWDGQSQGYFVPLAATIRSQITVPVVVAGGITDSRTADGYIREGKVDLVAVGRAMLANPDWAVEARAALPDGH